MKNSTDIETGSMDPSTNIVIGLVNDGVIKGLSAKNAKAYLQFALLYHNHKDNTKRYRIFNLSLNTTASMSDIFRDSAIDANVHVLLKRGWVLFQFIINYIIYFCSHHSNCYSQFTEHPS